MDQVLQEKDRERLVGQYIKIRPKYIPFVKEMLQIKYIIKKKNGKISYITINLKKSGVVVLLPCIVYFRAD